MKTKQKTVFALVPTQKLMFLRCLSKAFDNSKIRLKKGGLQNCKKQKSQLRDEILR